MKSAEEDRVSLTPQSRLKPALQQNKPLWGKAGLGQEKGFTLPLELLLTVPLTALALPSILGTAPETKGGILS